MEEIARYVEMSKTTLYVYFKNKEKIRNYSFFEDILQNKQEGARVIFSQWGSPYGLITLALNKEDYILQQMKLTKEEFLRKGFEDLYISFECVQM